MRGASLVKVFNLLMLCEVIAYILSRQRLSAKTFVAGYFFMLCRIDCLCGCCATPLVSERGVEFSPRVRPSGITHGYAWCVPRWGQWVRAGRFLFSLPLHSPLSTGSPFGHHPRLRMVCPPLGTVDRNCCFYYHSYQEKLIFCCHVVTAE